MRLCDNENLKHLFRRKSTKYFESTSALNGKNNSKILLIAELSISFVHCCQIYNAKKLPLKL
jgi:hypothetical protein